jgi:ligand-binding SRPBCC domain-containing protein
MTLHRLETWQRLPVSPLEAWRFFTDPRNLAWITPSEMGFQVTTPLPAHVYPGLLIGYRVRPLFGIPVDWVTEITHVVEGSMFVDEQRAGPYRLWHHEHLFIPAGNGTEVRDAVYYMLPFGKVGGFAHALVHRRLQHIFEYRLAALERIFKLAPSPADQQPSPSLAWQRA